MNESPAHAYRCSGGHEWAADVYRTIAAGGATPTCPRCGQPGLAPLPPAAPARRVEPVGEGGAALAVAASSSIPPPRPPWIAPAAPLPSILADPRPTPSDPAAAMTTPHTPQSPRSLRHTPGLPVFAGYATLAELGRGGMGTVYRARHEKLKRVVALKRIMVAPQAEPQYLARFQAEAEAVARLHHPNIIQIFETGEQDGWPFLSLEYVTGGALKDRLGGTPQPTRAAVELIAQIARAVHAAHQRGIVHLDLKPANILLQRDSGQENVDALSEAAEVYGIPKVNDFGLARRLDDDDMAIPGEVVGTPAYMAPEQALDKGAEVGVPPTSTPSA